jgi:hypothetical protein
MTTITPAKRRFFIADAIVLQRLEGLVALVAGTVAYAMLGQSWLVFALMFFVPDLFMLGYVRSARTGALVYNLGHTYVTPALVALLGLVAGPLAFGIAAIWVAHIGFDRVLGYGLKSEEGFKVTHLGRVGKEG